MTTVKIAFSNNISASYKEGTNSCNIASKSEIELVIGLLETELVKGRALA